MLYFLMETWPWGKKISHTDVGGGYTQFDSLYGTKIFYTQAIICVIFELLSSVLQN